MKKITKAIISLSTVSSMLLIPIFSASAAIAPLYTGDVDMNFKVDINDVTLLQNALSSSVELDKRQWYVADVNFNGVNDVVDVTAIQNKIAGNIEFDKKVTYEHTVHTENFCADYDSGKAMVGVPVTFEVTPYGGVEPLTCEFLIDGEVVQERGDSNVLTYTFNKVGHYRVVAKCYNLFDEYAERCLDYTVVDAYESENPIICGIHTDKDYISYEDRSVTITANAIFGTAPYQYKFTFGDNLIVQDFSENNELFIDKFNELELEKGEYTVLVEVRDADGKTAEETFTFEVDWPRC